MTTKEIEKLDEQWALLIKDKAGYKCEHCGITGTRMEAAHVVGRRHRGTRWGAILPNIAQYDLCGHCLCHVCHQQYDEHGPKEPYIVEKTIGVLRKALIQQKAQHNITKGQFYEDIKLILDKEREKWELCLPTSVRSI